MMRTGTTAGLVLISLLLGVPGAYAAGRAKLLITSDTRTQAEIAQDISRFVAQPADLKLDIVATAGPVEALQQLQREPDSNMAILPASAPHAYANAANRGNQDAAQAFAPVRVVAPLYSEEIYFIARADSPYNTIQDIQNARINVGAAKGTTALSIATLYRLLFGRLIAEKQLSTLRQEDALISLITDRSVDVVAIIGDQPIKVLADMKPEARQFIKVLRYDPSHQSRAEVLKVFSETSLVASNYPNVLTENMPALALTSYLVVYRPRLGVTDSRMDGFAKSWCQNVTRLRASGHPKLQAIALLPMDQFDRWPYANSTIFAPADCTASGAAHACVQESRALGLCD